jgi:hypothetical protein
LVKLDLGGNTIKCNYEYIQALNEIVNGKIMKAFTIYVENGQKIDYMGKYEYFTTHLIDILTMSKNLEYLKLYISSSNLNMISEILKINNSVTRVKIITTNKIPD